MKTFSITFVPTKHEKIEKYFSENIFLHTLSQVINGFWKIEEKDKESSTLHAVPKNKTSTNEDSYAIAKINLRINFFRTRTYTAETINGCEKDQNVK